MIFMDSNETLWVATQSGLPYRRSGEHAFRAVPDVTGSVTSVVQTPDGTVWLGSPLKSPNCGQGRYLAESSTICFV
jgi:ligand-binding sensor domain-containing protein